MESRTPLERFVGVLERALPSLESLARDVHRLAERIAPAPRAGTSDAADRLERNAPPQILPTQDTLAATSSIVLPENVVRPTAGAQLARQTAEWLSIQEVAQLAHVSTKSVRRAIAKGELAAATLTSSARRPTYRINRQAIEEWLKRNTAGSVLPAAARKTDGKYRSRHFSDL